MKITILTLLIFFSSLEISAQSIDSVWQVKNLPINSEFDEYMPFLVDTILIFTSTRKNSREDKIFENTEKIYYTPLIDISFGKIRKFTYKANSDANSALIGCSKSHFFFYRSYFNNNGEIFLAPRREINIKMLKKIQNILSDKDENSISIVEDSIYFTSNRNGNYDIYLQTKKEKPIPLDVLNSGFEEQGVWISSTNNELYFSSNREGSFDIYCSDKVDGVWQIPKRLPFPINTEFDEQDFRKHNDSTFFLASNRSGGVGGYDLYRIMKNETKKINTTDTSELIIKEPEESTDTTVIIITEQDSLTSREQLLIELKKLDLIPFRGEIQLGAYRNNLTSVELFKDWFDCIKDQNIRMNVFDDKKEKLPLNKFIIDQIYTDLDSALNKQKEIIRKGCLPTTFEGTPFIALLRADKKRYAIFWKEEEYKNKEVFWITLEGKKIWQSN